MQHRYIFSNMQHYILYFTSEGEGTCRIDDLPICKKHHLPHWHSFVAQSPLAPEQCWKVS